MPTASQVFERRSWLARVWRGGDSRAELIGTAFAISSRELLTCAHVIQDAGAKGPGDRVYVDFPLMGGTGNWATVLEDGWRPTPSSNAIQSAGDTAVLRLESSSLSAEPIQLRRRESYKGVGFSCYGFPVSNPESDTAHGKLDLSVGLEWIRVETDSHALVEPGFSGAAVWDDDAQGVVAMIVTRKQRDRRVAYAVPMTVVANSSEVVAAALKGSSEPLGWLHRAPLSIEVDMISFSSYMAERTRDFVGREFVFEAIDRQLADPNFPAGYIFIRGEPGYGKSAILSQFAQTRGFVHHFNIASDNVRSPAQFIRNACAQLIARYELPYKLLPANATESSKIFESLLLEASLRTAERKERQVVVLVDALDEAEVPVIGVNRLWLPRALPQGVYVIASIRKNVELLLDVDQTAGDILLDGELFEKENDNDVRRYVTAFLVHHWNEMKDRLEEWDTTREEFTQIVCQQSERNFMYLRYVLPDIRSGRIKKESLSRLEELPRGLSSYYSRHWTAMQDQDRAQFRRLKRPILCMLASAREAVTAECIAEWINDSNYFEPTDAVAVEEVFDEWAQFIHEEPGIPRRYRFYHASFLDFLERKVGLKRYLQAAAAAMRSKVDWEAQ